MLHNDSVTPENVYQKICSLSPLDKAEYRQYDGIAFARMFSDTFNHVLRYNITSKTYMAYIGTKWVQDTGNMIADSYAKMFARAIARYAIEHEEAPKEFIRAAQSYGDYNKRRILIIDARSYNPISKDDLDKYPYLLNCLNGVLDLNSMKLLPHDPKLLLSKQANFIYDPSARSDLFIQFMDEIMNGDKEKIKYIQILLGSSMLGENPAEEFHLFYGITTRNGKSTLLGVVEFLFGDYACSINPESLAQAKDASGRTASGDIARLDGIRFLHCSELPKRMKLNVELIKKMTGGDVLTARHLYEREFSFVPVFNLFVNTNYLPIVLDNSLFTSGRVKIVTFDRHFEPHEQDLKLKSKLRSPENLSGIANWLLEGLKMYHEQGDRYIVPDSVLAATADYMDKSDKLQTFLDDQMTKEEDGCVSAKALYDAYAQWCKENGYGVDNKRHFMDDLRSKNLLQDTGTIGSKTVRNVVKGYSF